MHMCFYIRPMVKESLLGKENKITKHNHAVYCSAMRTSNIHLCFKILHFNDLLDMSVSLLLHFLPVLSLETSVCSILIVCPVFWGHDKYEYVVFFYF